MTVRIGEKEAVVRHRLGFKQLVGREGQERGARFPGGVEVAKKRI